MLGQVTSASSDRIDRGAREALRRGLLFAARRDAPVQDRIDCAVLALDAGLRDMAAALYGLSALQLGTRAGAALLQSAEAEAGLWGSVGDGAALARPVPGFAFDIAIAELAELMASRPMLAPEEGSAAALLPAETPVGTPLGHALDQGMLGLAERVMAILRAFPRHDAAPLATTLRELAPELLALAPVFPDEHVDAPVETLGALLALEGVRRFVVDNADLLRATSESDVLFDRAAGLQDSALGPYFSNVRLLIRTVRDIFALIDAAAGGAADRQATETWCVLLSTHLKPHQMTDLVDELGDRGMTEALRRLLVRIARAGTLETFFDAVRRVRDVALDLGAFALAADAQHLVARWRRGDSNEWKILGDIAANGSDGTLADTAYGRALFLSPHNADARRNMAMAQIGTPVLIKGGLEVPEGRRRLRLARVEAYRQAR